MDSALRARLHDLTLSARHLLTTETAELLEGVYGLHRDGHFEPAERLPAITQLAEVAETRARLERLLADEKTAGLSPREAVAKLTKEAAYTWLNRVAAFKMLEARRLIRPSVGKAQQSGGFMLWVAEPGNEEDYTRYEAGSLPVDALGEGPRDMAYRHYLLHLCARMAGQVRVLFDPDDLPSRLCPRPRALADLLALVNVPEAVPAWDDDETIGWIYQSFNAQELEAAFREVRLSGKKFEAADIPAVTQLFTPRFVVRYLVENTLGRLWLQMHPDSHLRDTLAYLVPDVDAPTIPPKPVREITLLDPACGTMHFGLIAFDLFAEMYREELERVGEPGWPAAPSVREEREIAAAIVEHNLFGIDIDLRAVQLSALTLYLKSASLDPHLTIRHSNLACADVLLLNGKRLEAFIAEARFSRPIYERIIRAVWSRLHDANQLGSLLPLQADIRSLVEEERNFYRLEGQGRLPFPELRGLFEEEADEDAYWRSLDQQILNAFHHFAREQAAAGVDQTYFAGEAVKGMRLLDLMMREHDVVVTNPPYMSNRKMNNRLKTLVSDLYPAGKGDLYAAFIQRCLEFAGTNGRVGMLTMHSFMFISSYEALRTQIRSHAVIEILAHYGPALFDVGNPGTLQTAAYVLRSEPSAVRRDESVGTYIRLVREPDAEAKRRGFERAAARLRANEGDPAVYRYRQGDFDAIPGSPWVYWITPGLRRLFQTLPKLAEIGQPRQGTATSDNLRFLRYWWETGTVCIGFFCEDSGVAKASGEQWFPYMKGGEFRRWWGNQEYVVNWRHDAEEMRAFEAAVIRNPSSYFRRGITWTDLTSSRFAARLSPGGFIFDVAGSSVFPPDVHLVLGVMNSTFAQAALKMINPTVHVQVGDLARLPIPEHDSEALRHLVSRAIALARADSAEDETTYEFIAPPAWPYGMEQVAARHADLAAVERAIDEEVYRLYGISAEDRAAIEAELAEPEGASELTAEETEGTEGEQEEGKFKFPDGGGEMADTPAPVGNEHTGYAPAKAGNGEVGRAELARRWVSYAVGIVLGRFEPGVAGALGSGMIAPDAGVYAGMAVPAPEMLAVADGGIAPEVATALRALAVPAGIAPVEAGHPADLAGRVVRALDLLVGEDQTEALLSAATGGRPLAEWLTKDFFKEHVKRYRKRPIYWLLQSPKRTYGAYLFSERVTPDTLHLLRGSGYLGGRNARTREELVRLRERIAGMPQGAERRRAEKTRDALDAELADLEAFDKLIAAVTSQPNSRGQIAGWAPELDDGILINLAPLYTLLPGWSAEPKQCWAALERGEYDWSHTAMRYWPDRVLAKCRENKSYAIAHGVAVPEAVAVPQSKSSS